MATIVKAVDKTGNVFDYTAKELVKIIENNYVYAFSQRDDIFYIHIEEDLIALSKNKQKKGDKNNE